MVEAGTYKGGSANMRAALLEQLNPDSKVITIDVRDQTRAARSKDIWRRRVEFPRGRLYAAPSILEKVRQKVEGKRVLVILDSL